MALDARALFGGNAPLRGLGALPIMPVVQTATSTELTRAISAAMRVGDLWTRDEVWARAANTRLTDFRAENCCTGAANCKSIYCLFQMWSMDGVDCTAETFPKYILQFDRFAKAQQELNLLLSEARVRNLGATWAERKTRYDAMVTDSRAALAANLTISREARWWAEWVTRVMALVAVARWSLNVRWTLVRQQAPLCANENAFLSSYYFASGAAAGGDMRMGGWRMPTCTRVGDDGNPTACSGSTALAYPTVRDAETIVEGFRPNGLVGPCNDPGYANRSEGRRGVGGASDGIRQQNWLMFRSRLAVPSIVRLSDNATLFGQTGGEWMSCSGRGPVGNIGGAPLKRNVRVPVNERDFRPVRDIGVPWSPNWAQSVVLWPTWASNRFVLRGQTNPDGTDVVQMLEAWFDGTSRTRPDAAALMNGLVAWGPHDLSLPVRDENEVKGYPTPISQVMYAMALAQDIVDHAPGAFVEGAMTSWFAAYELLPARFKTMTPTQLQAAQRSFKAAQLNEILSYYSATAGTIAGIVGAINPIAGLVVTVILALVGMLIQFAQEICATLADSPPCIASPFVRFIGATDTENNCDLRTTNAGGAAAIEPRAGIIGAAAGAGYDPAAVWDLLRSGNTGIDGEGNQRDDGPGGGGALANIGGYVLGGVALVALASLGVLAFRRK